MSNRPKSATTRPLTRTKSSTTPASTTTRTTRATSKVATVPTSTMTRKPSVRKPLVSRANSPDIRDSVTESKANNMTKHPVLKAADLPMDTDREPIKAFLRIRPHLGDGEPTLEPYLDPISDTAVRMSEPNSPSHTRSSSVNPSSIYTFSHVFPPDGQQSDFFNKTTLPLVRDLLEGQSGLLFTYGVTNSGKTYTIQGGSEKGSVGILPRTLDVVFNSIDGLHGDGRYRPVRLNGIELADDPSEATSNRLPKSSSTPALADILDDLPDEDTDIDPTVFKLDRNHEYTVWLSYSEVYNEKVYDLFASIDSAESSQSSPAGIPRPTSTFLNLPLSSSQSDPLLLSRKALPVKPCPPSDSGLQAAEAGNAGKYVSGLRQIRVKSAAQAKALLRLGQLHRRVFGTLANSQSSRSHALVTIKVLRVHRGERNDPSSIQTSRLTLVDLAGSERTKYTQTSGDRLREAGNINKSLMVLGQCMETLRANQRAIARSLATAGGRMDTRDVKKGLAIVPFRHSKLTEVLMDYFVGEGRAVMIVNVNPYDTGFDENSHVMRFAALAREVCTAPAAAVPRALPVGRANGSQPSGVVPHRRKVTISMGGPGRKASEAHLEVLEEDEEPDEGDEDEGDADPINPLVDALFDEIERLRTQLYEAEMRCALVEADTREEVMEEMEERMRSMQKMFERRLVKEVEQNERKMDAKIDMMNRPRAYHPAHPQSHSEGRRNRGYDEARPSEKESEETADEMDDGLDYSQGHASSDGGRSPSPLAKKGKRNSRRANTVSPRRSTRERHQSMKDADEQTCSQDYDEESVLPNETESSDELKTMPRRPSQVKHHPFLKKARHDLDVAPSPIFEADVRAGKGAANRMLWRASGERLASLQHNLDELSLQDKPRDSTAIIPNRKARQEAVAHGGLEYVPQPGEVDTVKKKKRQLGRNRAMNDDEVAAIVLGTSQESGQSRRSGRQ